MHIKLFTIKLEFFSEQFYHGLRGVRIHEKVTYRGFGTIDKYTKKCYPAAAAAIRYKKKTASVKSETVRLIS